MELPKKGIKKVHKKLAPNNSSSTSSEEDEVPPTMRFKKEEPPNFLQLKAKARAKGAAAPVAIRCKEDAEKKALKKVGRQLWRQNRAIRRKGKGGAAAADEWRGI